jgi:predicted MPP superfamily phosphohydrolase
VKQFMEQLWGVIIGGVLGAVLCLPFILSNTNRILVKMDQSISRLEFVVPEDSTIHSTQIEVLNERTELLEQAANRQSEINNLILDILEQHQEDMNQPIQNDPMLLSQLIHAIEQVESNGNMNAVGDNGASIGSFQIGRAYWQDAVEYNPNLGGSYEDVATDRQYAIRVMLSYWSRYAKQWTPEELARQHNGGPNGLNKQATESYWNKVQKEMNG